MRHVVLAGIAAMVMAGMVTVASAELKSIGTGADMQVDISSFPANMKASYPLFKAKCSKCHGLDRTIVTLQTGMTPSGAVFDNAAVDAYAAKMLRKPDSDMSKSDVKSVMEMMRFMLEEAAK